MVDLPADAPVTRRDFHTELMVVWLFILLATTANAATATSWTAFIAPVGALVILLLHARALRRALRPPAGSP